MTIQKLFANFDNYLPLDEQERDDLSKRVVERRIKRRQFILQENDICRHYTFVAEGCFRKFQVDKKGVEHNLQFAAENDRPAARWIMEIDSFYAEKPSRVYIEAIEPSVILQISKPDLLHLFMHNPKFDRNFRVIIENRFVELENRVLQAISSTAEERYVTFLDQYPNLSQRLPNTQIASYLGITPEFLSKIRKEISKKQVNP
ncbi:Crp/Fnr family transcriptional regulator [Spirosoma endophyticum]|uniref:cAMP-binding domain of CRP or a regulatory subunit of cAMP-dependent protein kinases n=1 Tax=Spirosoma endophyticum TaxID=662367 RepID=A0A1I2DAR3_9BACT|nr:Crp/Fnr family transcriptional regulator [Spirosoma endophyticum]SFE77213.1 cAMP-binding domain of CRP or a regulatory subunit of cAMP-dependent protein kinases [Spirosoma endophyticum]